VAGAAEVRVEVFPVPLFQAGMGVGSTEGAGLKGGCPT